MPEIVTAVQRGSQVYVYGPNQRQLCSVFAGNGPNDGLTGFISSAVNVRCGSNIYVYGAQGAAGFQRVCGLIPFLLAAVMCPKWAAEIVIELAGAK